MRFSTRFLAMFGMGLGVLTNLVQAQLPDNRIEYFQMHEDPGDSSSPITYVVTVNLQAADRVDNSVGWSITGLAIEQPSTEQSWFVSSPEIDTPDGLWWIDHVDADAPDASEFTAPPPLAGEAIADSNEYADLSYSLVGSSYTASGPYAITSSLSYHLHPVAGLDPGDDGDHEPVESSGGPETG